MTKPSTTSKPSTASATDTGKNNKARRWFRIAPSRPDLPEIDQLLDLYWGGPERRITGLTVRIIAVNAVALIMLIIGVLYLSQYQANLIEAKLEIFKARVDLVSVAIAESATEEDIKSGTPGLERIIEALSQAMNQRIVLFSDAGQLIIDSDHLDGGPVEAWVEEDSSLYSFQILKTMARMVLKILPERRKLPLYSEVDSQDGKDYPDVQNALAGDVSFSAWSDENEHIFLSAAAPLLRDNRVLGAVLLTRPAQDIEQDIAEVWLNILKAFLFTSIVTILLSIYLSGVIARPLRKLANSTEGVRKGKLTYDDIPDMSDRHDEIGELSIALRQMTAALGDRMDSIERFAADVAHELKNPLTSLRSAVETAAVVKKKSDREKLMSIIMHDVERMDRLITDISTASRLDAELSREALEEVDLKAVLNHLMDAYKGPLARDRAVTSPVSNKVMIDDKHIRLSIEHTGDILVWGLAGRLEQVLQNLLSNALSFSPKGGEVLITVTTRAKRAIIIFEDQGPGIPENKLETIFERFYSQRPAGETYGKHSGLGLSICKQIVEALGGQIFAENIKNAAGKISGSRFTVILSRV